MNCSVSADVKTPAHVVWSIVTDLDNSPNVITSLVSVERTGDNKEKGSFTVGTKWKETRKIWGREETEEMYITSINEPDDTSSSSFPKSYVVESDSCGAHYVTTMRVEDIAKQDAGDGPSVQSRVTMEFGGNALGLGSRIMMMIMGPLMRGSMEKMCQADVDEIGAAAEKQFLEAASATDASATKGGEEVEK